MIDATTLNPGMILTFECRSTFIPNIYTNVKLLAQADSSLASAVSDIYATHANIVGDIPDIGATADDYNYLIVETTDGERHAVGIPWIKDNLKIVTLTKGVITVEGLGPADLNNIIRMIQGRGWLNTTGEIVSE